jgi:hypothetical protein
MTGREHTRLVSFCQEFLDQCLNREVLASKYNFNKLSVFLSDKLKELTFLELPVMCRDYNELAMKLKKIETLKQDIHSIIVARTFAATEHDRNIKFVEMFSHIFNNEFNLSVINATQCDVDYKLIILFVNRVNEVMNKKIKDYVCQSNDLFKREATVQVLLKNLMDMHNNRKTSIHDTISGSQEFTDVSKKKLEELIFNHKDALMQLHHAIALTKNNVDFIEIKSNKLANFKCEYMNKKGYVLTFKQLID